MLEVEVKIKADLQMIASRLEELGYVRGTTVYEKDTYYNGTHMDMKSLDKALRIREHTDMDTKYTRYVLNYKGPKLDDSTMTREETQFDIPSFEAGNSVLQGLGFYPAGGVEKTRIHYKRNDVVCCLDSVTNLGEYLEIEIMASLQTYDEAITRIRALLHELGLDFASTVRTSYLSMLSEE